MAADMSMPSHCSKRFASARVSLPIPQPKSSARSRTGLMPALAMNSNRAVTSASPVAKKAASSQRLPILSGRDRIVHIGSSAARSSHIFFCAENRDPAEVTELTARCHAAPCLIFKDLRHSQDCLFGHSVMTPDIKASRTQALRNRASVDLILRPDIRVCRLLQYRQHRAGFYSGTFKMGYQRPDVDMRGDDDGIHHVRMFGTVALSWQLNESFRLQRRQRG